MSQVISCVHVVPHFGCVTTQTSSGRTLMSLTLWQWFAKLGVTRIISGFDLTSSRHFPSSPRHLFTVASSTSERGAQVNGYSSDILFPFLLLCVVPHWCTGDGRHLL